MAIKLNKKRTAILSLDVQNDRAPISANLAQALHNADANTLLIVAPWTNYVVEATARHASDLGHRVFIVEDACASNTTENHDFAIENILPTLCYIATAQDVRATLK